MFFCLLLCRSSKFRVHIEDGFAVLTEDSLSSYNIWVFFEYFHTNRNHVCIHFIFELTIVFLVGLFLLLLFLLLFPSLSIQAVAFTITIFLNLHLNVCRLLLNVFHFLLFFVSQFMSRSSNAHHLILIMSNEVGIRIEIHIWLVED